MTAMENATRDGFSFDPGTTVMPVKCAGLVKVSFLLKLFAKGIEGVLVLGCHEGDCHYYNGSERCGQIVEETREILGLAGIPARRLGFSLIADSQGKELKRAVTGFGKQFKTVSRKKAIRRKSTAKGPAKSSSKKSTARSRRGVRARNK